MEILPICCNSPVLVDTKEVMGMSRGYTAGSVSFHGNFTLKTWINCFLDNLIMEINELLHHSSLLGRPSPHCQWLLELYKIMVFEESHKFHHALWKSSGSVMKCRYSPQVLDSMMHCCTSICMRIEREVGGNCEARRNWLTSRWCRWWLLSCVIVVV